jgi:hypothetical protein
MGRKSMTLEAVNARLREHGVSIRTKGERLYLRVRLDPPKGGSRKQYDLPMGYHTQMG